MGESIFSKYNEKNCLIVISGYPKRGEIYSSGVCAVSSFTKNTILRLREQNPKRKIVVLTMQTKKKEVYQEDGVLVIRCFKRNSPLSYLALVSQILRFNKVKDVLIEFEFASFGNTLATSLMAPFVFVLFLLRKNVFLTVHQVLFDISDLSGHIGIRNQSPKLKILNFGLKWFYFMLAMPAKKIVVLEEEFKKRLSKVGSANKIAVIPHGVDTNIREVDKANFRKKLEIKNDEVVLLYFGYLTWYKGADFLVSALKNIDNVSGRKVRLILGGGASFTQEQKTHYQKFLRTLSNNIKKSRNIIWTGFVAEKDITPIFEASDLIILPYRTFMSSSGPFSLAISHKKPFIISEQLERLLNSSDIKAAMGKAGVKNEDIVFKMNKKSLLKAIERSLKPKFSNKMSSFGHALSKERSFESIAKMYNILLTIGVEEKAGVFEKTLSLSKN